MTIATLGPLIRALEHRDVLTVEERTLIEALPMTVRGYRRGDVIVAEGSRPSASCLVLSGFTGRVQFTVDGKRQITELHMSGDFVDLHGLLLRVMDHSVVALSDCEVTFVPHENIRQMITDAPHLGRLLWLSTLIDGAIQRNAITGMGRRSSEAHLAHLLCELYVRLEAVGLAEDGRFDLPLTQEQLADILGLSIVHVNRTLQELRRTGLVVWQGSAVAIIDFDGLAELAGFDPVYLNLFNEPR